MNFIETLFAYSRKFIAIFIKYFNQYRYAVTNNIFSSLQTGVKRPVNHAKNYLTLAFDVFVCWQVTKNLAIWFLWHDFATFSNWNQLKNSILVSLLFTGFTIGCDFHRSRWRYFSKNNIITITVLVFYTVVIFYPCFLLSGYSMGLPIYFPMFLFVLLTSTLIACRLTGKFIWLSVIENKNWLNKKKTLVLTMYSKSIFDHLIFIQNKYPHTSILLSFFDETITKIPKNSLKKMSEMGIKTIHPKHASALLNMENQSLNIVVPNFSVQAIQKCIIKNIDGFLRNKAYVLHETANSLVLKKLLSSDIIRAHQSNAKDLGNDNLLTNDFWQRSKNTLSVRNSALVFVSDDEMLINSMLNITNNFSKIYIVTNVKIRTPSNRNQDIQLIGRNLIISDNEYISILFNGKKISIVFIDNRKSVLQTNKDIIQTKNFHLIEPIMLINSIKKCDNIVLLYDYRQEANCTHAKIGALLTNYCRQNKNKAKISTIKSDAIFLSNLHFSNEVLKSYIQQENLLLKIIELEKYCRIVNGNDILNIIFNTILSHENRASYQLYAYKGNWFLSPAIITKLVLFSISNHNQKMDLLEYINTYFSNHDFQEPDSTNTVIQEDILGNLNKSGLYPLKAAKDIKIDWQAILPNFNGQFLQEDISDKVNDSDSSAGIAHDISKKNMPKITIEEYIEKSLADMELSNF